MSEYDQLYHKAQELILRGNAARLAELRDLGPWDEPLADEPEEVRQHRLCMSTVAIVLDQLRRQHVIMMTQQIHLANWAVLEEIAQLRVQSGAATNMPEGGE